MYALTKEESNRLTYLRAICMVMVIVLHQYQNEGAFTQSSGIVLFSGTHLVDALEYIISRIVTFTAVPLFYAMSAVLLYRGGNVSWRKNLPKKAKTLFIPYVVWITLYILLYFVGQSLPMTKSYFLNGDRLVADMSAMDFMGAYTGYFGGKLFVNALWFVRDLILLNILAPGIKFLVDKFPKIVFVILMLLWFTGTSVILNNQSIVFFTLGYYIIKKNWRMEQLDRLPFRWMGIAYLGCVVLEYWLYFVGAFRAPVHGLGVLLGIALLVKLSKQVTKDGMGSILCKLAKYSFFVYASHDFIQTIYKKLISIFLSDGWYFEIIKYITVPVITCVTCLVVACLLEKWLPVVYRILSGNRKQEKRLA